MTKSASEAITLFFSFLLLLSVTAACGESGSGSSSGAPSAPGYQDGTWLEDDLNAALSIAAALDRPVVMDLYADWCGPCLTLGEEYFTSEGMQPILAKAVLLRVDIDQPDGSLLAEEFGVNAIPAVIILLPDRTEVDRIVGVAGTIDEYGSALDALIEEALGQI
jgi:thiol:disulfide interchange protein